MTDDLFEHRLRRDLDVIAQAVPVGSPRVALGQRRSRRRLGVVAVAAAAAVVVAVGVLASSARTQPEHGRELLTADGLAESCARPNPAEPLGERWLIGTGEVAGLSWRATTTGIADGQLLETEVEVDHGAEGFLPSGSGGVEAPSGFFRLTWHYDSMPEGWVVYGFLPPEASVVVAGDDHRSTHACPVDVVDGLRYFALGWVGSPERIEVLDEHGTLLAVDEPELPSLDPAIGHGIAQHVALSDDIDLPIGGHSWAPPAEEPPLARVTSGKTGEVTWELRADRRGAELSPGGGGFSYHDSLPEDLRLTPHWEMSWLGSVLVVWGQVPPDRAASMRIELADSSRVEVDVHPPVDDADPFGYFAAAFDHPVVIVAIEALDADGQVLHRIDTTTHPELRTRSENEGRGFSTTVPALRVTQAGD